MQTHNKQLGIRLPWELYKRLAAEASLERMSLSKYVRKIIDSRPPAIEDISDADQSAD